MFSTITVGKKISALRKERNMTQMELADRMGVSFQAVSNWERGNSMPDISKLPELAEIFGVTIDELLGSASPLVRSAAENRMDDYLKENTVTVEALNEAAPILKPSQVDAAMESVPVESVGQLKDVAPFVSVGTLGRAALEAVKENDMDGIEEIAPFLEDSILAKIALQMVDVGKSIEGIAVYLDDAALAECAEKLTQQGKSIDGIAHYMDEDDVGECARILAAAGKPIENLLPFMDEDNLRDVALEYVRQGKAIDALAPFMDEDDLGEVAWEMYCAGGISKITGIACFLESDALQKIAEDAVKKHGLRSSAPIAPYLDD